MSAAFQHGNQNKCYYNWETELQVQQNYHLKTYGNSNLRSKNHLLGGGCADQSLRNCGLLLQA